MKGKINTSEGTFFINKQGATAISITSIVPENGVARYRKSGFWFKPSLRYSKCDGFVFINKVNYVGFISGGTSTVPL